MSIGTTVYDDFFQLDDDSFDDFDESETFEEAKIKMEEERLLLKEKTDAFNLKWKQDLRKEKMSRLDLDNN